GVGRAFGAADVDRRRPPRPPAVAAGFSPCRPGAPGGVSDRTEQTAPSAGRPVGRTARSLLGGDRLAGGELGMHRWTLARALAGAVLAATVFPGAAAGRVSADSCGSFGPESGTVELGKPATYTASAGGNHSMSVTVSWGDGSSSNTSLSSGGSDTLSHLYGQVGTYSTLVTISGILPDGTTPCGNSVAGSVTVTSPPAPPQSPPKAVYAASASTHYVGEVVIFSGGQSSDPDNDIASYGWNFGDGATFSGVVAPHVYSKAGTYTVNLTVTDSGGRSDSTSGVVTITDKPVEAPPNPFPPAAPPPAPTPPVATPPVQPLAPNAPSSPALG